jgi:hypothetical protein
VEGNTGFDNPLSCNQLLAGRKPHEKRNKFEPCKGMNLVFLALTTILRYRSLRRYSFANGCMKWGIIYVLYRFSGLGGFLPRLVIREPCLEESA